VVVFKNKTVLLLEVKIDLLRFKITLDDVIVYSAHPFNKIKAV